MALGDDKKEFQMVMHFGGMCFVDRSLQSSSYSEPASILHRGVMAAEWSKTGLEKEGNDVAVKHVTNDAGEWHKKCFPGCQYCDSLSDEAQQKQSRNVGTRRAVLDRNSEQTGHVAIET